MSDNNELKAKAKAATQGEWQVIESELPCRIGRPHVERRIFTAKDHPQLKAPYPVVNGSIALGTDETPVHHMVSMTAEDAAYIAAANPSAVLALIAENERLRAIHSVGPVKVAFDVMDERGRLRAEVAGIRTGYEAYEQVNAELKAEVDRLNEEYDKAWRHDLNDKKNVQALAAEVARLSADSEALRKDAERYRMVRGIASISAGRRHLVVKRLPVNGFGSSTARDFDASIDAALGQGEQS